MLQCNYHVAMNILQDLHFVPFAPIAKFNIMQGLLLLVQSCSASTYPPTITKFININFTCLLLL